MRPPFSESTQAKKTTLVDNPSKINDFFWSEQIFFKENIHSGQNKLCLASNEAHLHNSNLTPHKPNLIFHKSNLTILNSALTPYNSDFTLRKSDLTPHNSDFAKNLRTKFMTISDIDKP